MIFDGYTIPILLVFVASLLIQGYLSRAYNRWGQVRNSRSLTGADVARMMLDENGLRDVPVQMVPGHLSDHYDPMKKVVNLSEANYSTPSVAAMAVAAHEVGHAIQDKVHMPALVLRGRMAVPLSIGMNFAPLLMLAGIFLHMTGLLWVGVAFFGFAMLFHLITLPVEFDASRRALAYLNERGLNGSVEGTNGARNVLTAAALTYVAGFAMALLQFMQMLGFASRSSDR